MKIAELFAVTLVISVVVGVPIIAFFTAVSYLGRIADALEAQTRLHESWCESQETPFS